MDQGAMGVMGLSVSGGGWVGGGVLTVLWSSPLTPLLTQTNESVKEEGMCWIYQRSHTADRRIGMKPLSPPENPGLYHFKQTDRTVPRTVPYLHRTM